MEKGTKMSKEFYNRAKTTNKLRKMYGFEYDKIDIYAAEYTSDEHGEMLLKVVCFILCGIKYRSDLTTGELVIIEQ